MKRGRSTGESMGFIRSQELTLVPRARLLQIANHEHIVLVCLTACQHL